MGGRSAELRAEVQRLRSAELLRLGFVMALAMTLHKHAGGLCGEDFSIPLLQSSLTGIS